jgi:hypothetical protein
MGPSVHRQGPHGDRKPKGVRPWRWPRSALGRGSLAAMAKALISAGIGDRRADVLATLLTAAVIGGKRLIPIRVGGAQGRHCAHLGTPIAARFSLGQRFKA